ncbi:diguanylate cyclase [Sulfurovum sp.]|uniref:sensor domain-containing diguanylate cyclase n=1 Tax=Sulfurovum sp. TaxID=1969726 RepID=UPI0025D65BAF|nr:diguanylate cyclase [Sulfurovum sp.]
MKKISRFLLIVSFIFTHVLYAKVVFSDHENKYDDFTLTYFIDKSEDKNISEVATMPFSKKLDNAFTLGYTKVPVWFRIDIENKSSKKEEFYLFFERFNMGNFTVYEQKASAWKATEFGWKSYIEQQRSRFQSSPVYALRLKPGESKVLFVRIRTNIGLVGKFIVYADQEKIYSDQRKAFGFYLFVLGGLMMAILINGYLFISLKERIFGYYSAYLIGLVLFIIVYDTLALDFGWVKYYEFLQISGPLSIFFLTLFTKEFLRVRKYAPYLVRPLNIQAYIFAFLVVMMSIAIDSWFEIMGTAAPLAFAILLFTAYKVGYAGLKVAKYYFLLMFVNVLALALMALVYDGTLPYSDIALYSFMPVSFFEAAGFTMLLAGRIKEKSNEVIKVQNELIAEKKENENRLEERVKDRTSELIKLKDEMEYKLQRDALTSLYNRRHLATIVNELTQTQFSVVLIDVDHFKNINDNYGHSIGDKVLVKLAEILTDSIRTVDVAVRYGGEEFMVILPNLPISEAAKIAERIRINVEKSTLKYEDIEIKITISIGVSAKLKNTENIEDVFKKADDKLYEAKRAGRNRVCL